MYRCHSCKSEMQTKEDLYQGYCCPCCYSLDLDEVSDFDEEDKHSEIPITFPNAQFEDLLERDKKLLLDTYNMGDWKEKGMSIEHLNLITDMWDHDAQLLEYHQDNWEKLSKAQKDKFMQVYRVIWSGILPPTEEEMERKTFSRTYAHGNI